MDITRSHTGCWTCRSRRVKCDESRPVCSRCSRSGLTCGYDIRLTWQDDNDARGVCHGRAGVWSKSGKQRGQTKQRKAKSPGVVGPPFPRLAHTRFLNTTVADVQRYLGDDEQEQSDEGDCRLDHQEEILPDLGFPQHTLAHLTRPSKYASYDPILLSYYEAVICSTSTLLDDEKHNPYRHVLLPMALQSPGVYHTTLAISANTLRLARSEYTVIALEHRQQALRRLVTILNRKECDDSEMDEILGMVLMLCWFEISDGCNPSWVTHLKGFRGLLHRHRRKLANVSPHSWNMQQFFVRYFDFHLVLAKTTFRVDEGDSNADLSHPIVGNTGSESTSSRSELYHGPDHTRQDHDDAPNFSSSTSSLSLHMPLDSMDDIDPYMGFSNGLLLLINEITDIGPMASRTGDQARATIHARRLKTSLANLHQRLPESAVSSDMVTRRRAFVATAEAYRLGAIILLHEVLSRSYPAVSAPCHVITKPELDDAIQSILQLIDTRLEDMIDTAALPLWPLFLAGCCVDLEEDRMTALRLFEVIEQRKRFGNITPARKVMEMVWRQRDLGRDDRQQPARNRKGGRGTVEQYEWERASTLLGGWKISLT
ncbi:hypothetical protein A1O1_02535 [Capronia coronata CBS 617.96]|uniref:Zn(2)-C6 fungal-type domain-containing protein n=1 Tax=Capronia coronata CBS 617.96 TaxID=1182541 RepID=W9YMJ0_9EURO|nr:uncharacterized protein A1O1_02535 [Capronia coronata CBS 617.96]EXJ94142.1 hypothetical protein A1O1_02535 [Capronia coronata CBS 617.96]